MTTHEVDQFGMSPYGVVILEADQTEDESPASERIYVVKGTAHGLYGIQATPQDVADFLVLPSEFYRRRLPEFFPIYERVYQFRPDEIAKMDLPPSLFGHWCPACAASWPDALVRQEEALEVDRFHVIDGQWVLSHRDYDDVEQPEHNFLCKECHEIFTEDAAGRDLEEMYAEMLERELARKERYARMDEENIAAAQAECDRLNAERRHQEAIAELARIEAEAVAEGKRKTQFSIERGELCPHCHADMPGNLVAHQDAVIAWETEQNELGEWKFMARGVAYRDDIEYECGACETPIGWNDAWDHIEAGDDIVVESNAEQILRMRADAWEEGYKKALDRVEALVRGELDPTVAKAGTPMTYARREGYAEGLGFATKVVDQVRANNT